MVWYLTPDQVLMHRMVSKTSKKDDGNNNKKSREKEDPNYDFSIDKVQYIENKVVFLLNLLKLYVLYAIVATR